MAINNARGLHTSPGVYTKEVEVKYSNKTVGITTLGLTGETLKGPALQPTYITNWREYSDIFGGTSTEQFKGSKYPKYELPYIAQDYLTESNQLIVTRVLGLSGTNMGPAWAIKAVGKGDGDDMLVAIIRSRGHYEKTYGAPQYSNEVIASGNIESDTQYVVTLKQGATASSNDSIVYNGKTISLYEKFFGIDGEATYTTNSSDVEVRAYCGTIYDYDKLIYYVDPQYEDAQGANISYLQISPTSYDSPYFTCGKSGTWDSDNATAIPCTPSDYGTFILSGITVEGNDFSYTVSFNPGAKNYIYNVIGSNPNDNGAPIYIEELYDVALQQLIYKNGVDPNNYIQGIKYDQAFQGGQDNFKTQGLIFYPYDIIDTDFPAVNSLVTIPQQSVTRSLLGNRYLYSSNITDIEGNSFVTDYYQDTITTTINQDNDTRETVTETVQKRIIPTEDDGKIFVIKQDVDSSGKRTYNYHYIINTQKVIKSGSTTTTTSQEKLIIPVSGDSTTENKQYVFVYNEDLYYKRYTSNTTPVSRVIGDLNDYKEQFRYASTPWIVSEMTGTVKVNDVKKLFRFHTISDGNSSNQEIKISLSNIDPDSLTFDVIIRPFYDSDSSAQVLETFSKCNLNPVSSNYILNKIGSYDNSYPQKSKYVMVEVSNDETIRTSFPCGFLGYPVRDLNKYTGTGANDDLNINKPSLAYNITWDEETKDRKQYFGLSDITGIDVDILSYKGRSTYTDGVLTNGFHLDSRVSSQYTRVNGEQPYYCTANNDTCDDTSTPNKKVYLYTWETVSINNTLDNQSNPPVITSDEDILGTIYENKNLRKFTIGFYGGWDGWDTYRTSRTTSDDFKMNRYKGKINPNTGTGDHFSYIKDAGILGLPEKGITSDFYAYWAGIRTFDNPSNTAINVFATPGIDYVNDTMLVGEAIDMIEEPTNQNAIYIVTTPDKPFGASDSVSEMYTSDDVVNNLESVDIDSSYTATYYPWCRYYDSTEQKTLFLPITKDVVRLIALTDNTSFAWFPPAGDERGKVNCLSARFNLKIDDEDTLYSGRINPVKTYAQDGIYIWGQKNLKVSYDDDKEPLTRIGVRRMMLRIRDLIKKVNRQLIFTPNDTTVKNKFINNCSNILNDVRSNRGISDYRIEVDDSVEARENRSLPATIWVKPINMLEYIDITFAITPEGVELSDL